MIFVLLTVLSSLTIALILKFNETRSGNRLVLAGANYVVAALLGFFFSGTFASLSIEWTGFAALVGGGFVAGFLLLMRSIREIGLAVTVSVARTATLGPVLLSVLFYNERPGLIEAAGVGIGLLAFITLGIAQRKPDERFRIDFSSLLLLVVLFIVMILNDFAMKIVQFNNVEEATFLLGVFGVAGLICWGTVLQRKHRPTKKSNAHQIKGRDLLLGATLGVPNYFSSYFLILALKELPASSVFPIVSASGVVATTLAAVIIWRERPSKTAWLGIALATLAVALLGAGG